MRSLLALALLLTLLAATPLSAADEYRGACIKHKGTTGISVSVENCKPWAEETLAAALALLPGLLRP